MIHRVGSATRIARMCGFSEGVVRSWRDGHTDPSRARCVTLARTLGISLVWLVAGEGAIQIDPSATAWDEQNSSESLAGPHQQPEPNQAGTPLAALDPARLNTAMHILQSELELAAGQLTPDQRSAALRELVEIVSADGQRLDPVAMVRFNQRLAQRIRRSDSVA